ncbi:MAG TPA: phosphatidylglycerophosphatase A [Pyrinomonadaceae bacterium]|nr:phosphatidylglycerophosphatase A [Pyrinomonadaceae bacterium]
MKESSDELNPHIATLNAASAAPKRKTLGDYVALAIATCGVGYFPIAPGTMGSLVGIGIFMLFHRWVVEASFAFVGNEFFKQTDPWGPSLIFMWVLPLFIICLSLIGIWAASRAERLFGRKDPSQVVIDEVVGQLVTFMFVPKLFLNLPMAVAGFVLFRAFDIVKPYPIRRVENLHGGLGIVGDDIVAGLYAGATLALVALLAALHILPWLPQN